MNEEDIAASLRQNLQTADTPTPAPTTTTQEPASNQVPGQATGPTSYDLDDMTLYKLHAFFGVDYRPSDATQINQIRYIYLNAMGMAGSEDLGEVTQFIRDIEQSNGFTHDERRLYKTYQWVKLTKLRRSIDGEIGALSRG